MADFAGVAGGPANHLVIQDNPATDTGPHVHEDEAARAARTACPGFGDGGTGDVLVHQGFESGGLRQGVAQVYTVPAAQERRVDDGSLVQVDWSRRRDAKPGDLALVNARLLYQGLDLFGDPRDDGGRVAPGRRG